MSSDPQARLGYRPPIEELSGYRTLVRDDSALGLPTDLDREKQVNLPPSAATPQAPSTPTEEGDRGSSHDREIPTFETNYPDNDIPDRPRTLPTPGEEYGHPVKYDYNTVTRRPDVVARVVEAYTRRWRPGKRQKKQRGRAKIKRQQSHRRNRARENFMARLRYRRNKRNQQFQRVQKHRRKFPNQHKRRYGSLLGDAMALRVADRYLDAQRHDWNAPEFVPPRERQKKQRGDAKTKSRREFQKNPAAKSRQMSKRHEYLSNYRRYEDYKTDYNAEYYRHGKRPFRRRGSVLTTPQIEFAIGTDDNMVPGTVHSMSPMTGMVTFVVGAKDQEHLRSLPVMAFLNSVVFLSESDIEAMFDLIDVEIGPEAYQEIDEGVLRDCAAVFDIDVDSKEFADKCEALVEQTDLGSMSAEDLGLINDVLVTGYLEGGHTRQIKDGDEEDELYDWHLIYGEVPEPEEPLDKTAEGITMYFEREDVKQEIDYPDDDVGYRPTGPSHYEHDPDEKGGVPKGNKLPDTHDDDVPAGSSRVVPPGDGQLQGVGERSRTAATMAEIASRTAQKVHARAKGVQVRLKRADPQRGIWTFQAAGSKGQAYTIRVKGLQTGTVQRLDRAQVRVSCDCNFFRWQGPEHWAKSNNYLYGRPRGTATTPVVRDPAGDHWACKHLLAALHLARKYRFGSLFGWPVEIEVVPEYEVRAQRVADRWLGIHPIPAFE